MEQVNKISFWIIKQLAWSKTNIACSVRISSKCNDESTIMPQLFIRNVILSLWLRWNLYIPTCMDHNFMANKLWVKFTYISADDLVGGWTARELWVLKLEVLSLKMPKWPAKAAFGALVTWEVAVVLCLNVIMCYFPKIPGSIQRMTKRQWRRACCFQRDQP